MAVKMMLPTLGRKIELMAPFLMYSHYFSFHSMYVILLFSHIIHIRTVSSLCLLSKYFAELAQTDLWPVLEKPNTPSTDQS